MTKKVSEGEVLWNEIRGLPIDMFALPNQCVEDHLIRVAGAGVGVGDALYLRTKSPAALPALEAVLKGQVQFRKEPGASGDPVNVSYPKYTLEEADDYLIIKRFMPLSERSELQPVPEKQGSSVVMAPKNNK